MRCVLLVVRKLISCRDIGNKFKIVMIAVVNLVDIISIRIVLPQTFAAHTKRVSYLIKRKISTYVQKSSPVVYTVEIESKSSRIELNINLFIRVIQRHFVYCENLISTFSITVIFPLYYYTHYVLNKILEKLYAISRKQMQSPDTDLVSEKRFNFLETYVTHDMA